MLNVVHQTKHMIALLSNQIDQRIIASDISYEEELNLVSALIAHKPQAFKFLYRKYAPNLLGIILKIVKQQETAEDLLQETFIKIKQHIAFYDPNKARLFTWLLKISKNTAIDHLRKKTTRQDKHNQELEACEIFHISAIAYNTDCIGLKAWVRQLPERQRTLIEMVYFEGYTQTDISDNLQIPLGTVKTQLRSAILALRKIYQVRCA